MLSEHLTHPQRHSPSPPLGRWALGRGVPAARRDTTSWWSDTRLSRKLRTAAQRSSSPPQRSGPHPSRLQPVKSQRSQGGGGSGSAAGRVACRAPQRAEANMELNGCSGSASYIVRLS